MTSRDSGKETPASRIIEGAREALSIARGEQPAASITINGHKYVPASVVDALEAERDELKAGIKRLSDEEELINETGRDGMLTAVHIGARLAEAEELARVMEAEANQLREVSISHRNRAEALEESLKTVLASLVATTSLIIRAEDLKVKPSKAVASDKMFTQMLKDYDKATIAGRAALKGDS